MNKILSIIVCLIIVSPINVSAECKPVGNYYATIEESGIFFGKFTDYTLIAIVNGKDTYHIPDSWDNSNVKITKNAYGEDVCNIYNRTYEFLAKDKTGKTEIILPDRIYFKCKCNQ